MKLIVPEIEIDENDPFKNDKLNRKAFAESLLSLITNVEDGLVISLDAPWGDGKTTFVRMWQAFIKKADVKCLYFDAFANDSFEDPFTALVGSIYSLIEKEFTGKSATKRKLKDFKKNAVKVGARLLSLGVKFGVKAVTLNVVDNLNIEKLKGIKDDIASAISDSSSNFVEDKLNSYQEVLKATEEFKIKLGELAEEAYNKNQKPLVFIIDELDRCKPTYALELIEKIKHLFSVKHIVFVLVMHANQLEESVKCVYGQNIDARTYLNKFINIECKFSKKSTNQFGFPEDDNVKYCGALCELHELNGMKKIMCRLAQEFSLSLRDLEHCFARLKLCFCATKPNNYNGNCLLALLVVLKVKKPELFELLKTQNISFDVLWKHLEFGQVISRTTDTWKRDIHERLEVCLLPEDKFSKLDEQSHPKRYWESISFKYNFDKRSHILPYLFEKIESFRFVDGGE